MTPEQLLTHLAGPLNRDSVVTLRIVPLDVLRELVTIDNPLDMSPAAQQLIREIKQ